MALKFNYIPKFDNNPIVDAYLIITGFSGNNLSVNLELTTYYSEANYVNCLAPVDKHNVVVPYSTSLNTGSAYEYLVTLPEFANATIIPDAVQNTPDIETVNYTFSMPTRPIASPNPTPIDPTTIKPAIDPNAPTTTPTA